MEKILDRDAKHRARQQNEEEQDRQLELLTTARTFNPRETSQLA
jgi:hypothetical protein